MVLPKRVFFIFISCLPLLAACSTANIFSQKADEPTAPHLIDFTTKTKEMMGKSSAWMLSGVMSQVMDTVQSLPMIAIAGHNLKSGQNCLWNDGKAFTGLRVVVQGNAFSKGLVGQPEPVSVTIRSETGKSVISQGSGPFVMTGTYVYTATVPYITCQKMVEVEFEAPALREGEGDYEVLVGPLDNSASCITFRHPVSISDSFSRFAERSPDVNTANSTNSSTDQTGSEPKTQYELQQRQAEAERRRRY